MLNKVFVLSKSMLLSLIYSLSFFLNFRSVTDKNSEFCIFMTSYGYRLNYIYLTLESLFRQKFKPKNIYLFLSKEEFSEDDLPWTIKLAAKKGLHLVFIDGNTRSYKKLSYYNVVDLTGVKFIVTADDDVFYPNDWLLGFKRSSSVNPNSIHCYRGRIIKFSTAQKVSLYSDWEIANCNNVTGNLLIPTGVSGVCYPVDALSQVAFDFKSIETYCPYADDIWYKLMTTKGSYRSELVGSKSVHFTPIITGFRKGLEVINIKQDRNTEQFNQSLAFFKLRRENFND